MPTDKLMSKYMRNKVASSEKNERLSIVSWSLWMTDFCQGSEDKDFKLLNKILGTYKKH